MMTSSGCKKKLFRKKSLFEEISHNRKTITLLDFFRKSDRKMFL